MQAMQHGETNQTQIKRSRLLWAAPLAALAAAAANAILYVLAAAFEFFPGNVTIPASGEPMTLAPVVLTSVVGVLGAAVALALLARFVRTPVRIFRIIAVTVLVLSFATPFTIPDAPTTMVVSLLGMHIVAWLVSVTLLVWLAQPR